MSWYDLKDNSQLMNYFMLLQLRTFIILFALLSVFSLQSVEKKSASANSDTVDEESLDASGKAIKSS